MINDIRDAEYQAQMDADLQIIADAKASGFMDCRPSGMPWAMTG